MAVTAGKIEASTLAVIGAGTARTAAFARRVSSATHRTGARAAGRTARVVRRGSGRATVATRRGTRRAAAATKRAANHLVPDPVALPDQARDRGARAEPESVGVGARAGLEPVAVGATPEPEPVTVEATPEPEPVAVEATPEPEPVAAATTTAAGTALVSSHGDGRRSPPRRRPEHGQVVPLRPRATTRLKATGELLVLVAILGLVVSSIIVALAVAANQALSGL